MSSSSPSLSLKETQETQKSQFDLEEFQSQIVNKHWGLLIQQEGNRLELIDLKYTIGRKESNSLQINKSGVSGIHFEIELEQGTSKSLPKITDKSTYGTFLNGKKIGKDKTRYLTDFDKITINSTPLVEFCFTLNQSSENNENNSTNNNENEETTDDITNYYEISKVLGTGKFSMVKIGICKKTANVFAIKYIKKPSTKVENEIEIMKIMNHSNIIKLIESRESETYHYVVLEYASCGDLLCYMNQSFPNGMPEKSVKIIFKQILKGIEHIHKLNIVHRDIKADNILLFDKESLKIKITDFGISENIINNGNIKKLIGTYCTPQYAAPEIYKTDDKHNLIGYGKEVDMWSAGVLLFYLLSNEFPFKEDNFYSLQENILSCNYQFMPKENWKDKSNQVKQLIKKLLLCNTKERLTATDALKNKWFDEEYNYCEEIEEDENEYEYDEEYENNDKHINIETKKEAIYTINERNNIKMKEIKKNKSEITISSSSPTNVIIISDKTKLKKRKQNPIKAMPLIDLTDDNSPPKKKRKI